MLPMDYSLIHRTPDGTGKVLVTTPGSPDKGSWETEAELKTYVNQDAVMKTDIAQTLGQQIDKVPSNKAVDDAINAISGYSSTETVVGKWENQTLYRKVYTGTATSQTDLVPIDIISTKTKRMEFFFVGSNSSFGSDYYTSDSDRARCWHEYYNLRFSFGSSFPSLPLQWAVILEYVH